MVGALGALSGTQATGITALMTGGAQIKDSTEGQRVQTRHQGRVHKKYMLNFTGEQLQTKAATRLTAPLRTGQVLANSFKHFHLATGSCRGHYSQTKYNIWLMARIENVLSPVPYTTGSCRRHTPSDLIFSLEELSSFSSSSLLLSLSS